MSPQLDTFSKHNKPEEVSMSKTLMRYLMIYLGRNTPFWTRDLIIFPFCLYALDMIDVEHFNEDRRERTIPAQNTRCNAGKASMNTFYELLRSEGYNDRILKEREGYGLGTLAGVGFGLLILVKLR
jgi:hypothetical protein